MVRRDATLNFGSTSWPITSKDACWKCATAVYFAWIGEDPDFGTCDTIVAWHFDSGKIDGVDVAGRTIALIAHVPGNILQGN